MHEADARIVAATKDEWIEIAKVALAAGTTVLRAQAERSPENRDALHNAADYMESIKDQAPNDSIRHRYGE